MKRKIINMTKICYKALISLWPYLVRGIKAHENEPDYDQRYIEYMNLCALIVSEMKKEHVETFKHLYNNPELTTVPILCDCRSKVFKCFDDPKNQM